MSETLYKITVDLNVLDHLAEGLYSSVAAVLTEAVANAWDADAKRVDIDVNLEKDTISITDDGIGMDQKAINEHYLRVGYRRRAEGETSPNGRLVMGRKGIGKLSLMSIANVIQVFSKTDSSDLLGFRISVEDLRAAMESGLSEYKPVPLEEYNVEFPNGHGTRIIISELKRQRLQEVDPSSLRRRLARRFSVIGSEEFKVFVNGNEVTSHDREDIKFVEYLWKFDDTQIDTVNCQRLRCEPQNVDYREEEWPSEWTVRGWIGTVDRPKSLATPEGNLNSIVVLARGRLVQEDILPRISGAEVYTKYVTGQVEADFLDETNKDDIVTSNRQALIEDDERVEKLLVFIRKVMRRIAEEWSALRTTDRTSELRSKYPGVGEWLDDLQPGWKAKAEKLLERIATMDLGQDEEEAEEEARKTLLRHSILGFERLRLRGDEDELEKALSAGVERLLKLLADKDSLEASFYRDIVKNRLEVIIKLNDLTDENVKERVLQEYLFDHLWLLDPSWERATGSEALEERLRLKKFFMNDKITKQKYGRVDIRYRTVAGKHVIVELKRVSEKPYIYALADQGAKYVDALKEILPPEEKDRAIVEVVFVVGRNPDEPSERVQNAMNSVAPGSRLVTYEQLIIRARQAYSEYLSKMTEVDRIDAMFSDDSSVERID
ncbi:MAG: ATP-binding protein [Saprospirales bacterium]|nr:ATP-binding protein [Saprospirales bacterium]